MSSEAASRKGCSRCGDRSGHDPIADIQCALTAVHRADLLSVARQLDQPPGEPAVLDLFAHMSTIYEDGTLAHRAATRVLELGWRPSVVTS